MKSRGLTTHCQTPLLSEDYGGPPSRSHARLARVRSGLPWLRDGSAADLGGRSEERSVMEGFWEFLKVLVVAGAALLALLLVLLSLPSSALRRVMFRSPAYRSFLLGDGPLLYVVVASDPGAPVTRRLSDPLAERIRATRQRLRAQTWLPVAPAPRLVPRPDVLRWRRLWAARERLPVRAPLVLTFPALPADQAIKALYMALSRAESRKRVSWLARVRRALRSSLIRLRDRMTRRWRYREL